MCKKSYVKMYWENIREVNADIHKSRENLKFFKQHYSKMKKRLKYVYSIPENEISNSRDYQIQFFGCPMLDEDKETIDSIKQKLAKYKWERRLYIRRILHVIFN